MPVYTIEIERKVIAVFNAASKRTAERYVHEDQADLVLLRFVPDKESLREMVTVREATPIEYNRWQVARNRPPDPDDYQYDDERRRRWCGFST